MALIAHIYVNNTSLGYVAAVRQEPLVNPDDPDDEIHEYEVTAVFDLQILPRTRIKHRFGDGALALVSKMTQAVDIPQEHA